MRHEASRKPRKCPSCGSGRIARIFYGLPDFSPELRADLDAGRIALGGCCISDDDPKWQCLECESGIYKKDAEPSGEESATR